MINDEKLDLGSGSQLRKYMAVNSSSKDIMFKSDDIKKSEQARNIGPHYFASDRWCDEFFRDFKEENFESMINDFADSFKERLREDVADWLVSDTKSGIQQQMWSFVDKMVKHILAGDEWAIKRYVFLEGYEGRMIRKAIWNEFKDEIRCKRIDDLEKSIERLNEFVKNK